jgi:hypothetical protein
MLGLQCVFILVRDALTARQDEKLNAIERRVDRLEQASTVKHQ